MKKINKLFFVALASVLLVAFYSCKEDETIVDPSTLLINGASINGSSDSIPTQGVYFPTQEASGDHTFDPTMDKVITVQMARNNAEGAITVPVIVTASEEGIFTVGTASFADGQTETTFDVEFPNVETAVKYSLKLEVTDPSYAYMYSAYPNFLELSVFCVEWKFFAVDAEGKETFSATEDGATTITYTQNYWGETATGKLKYYEVEGVRHCVMLTDLVHYYNGPYEGYGFWGTNDSPETAMEWEFDWYTQNKNNIGGQFIDLYENLCYHNSTYDVDVYVYDWRHYWNDINANHYGYEFLDFASKYGDPDGSYPISYYDGNGGFYFYVRTYYMPDYNNGNGGGWGIEDWDIIGIADGFNRPVYSIEVSVAETVEGVAPVQCELGADVDSVKYVIAEGELSARDADKLTAAIIDGTAENVIALSAEEAAYFGFTAEQTGVYTIVLVAYDAEGNAQESTYKTFCYVKAGDEVPVIVNCGLAATGKYEPQGFLSDNSLEFYVYGSDLVDVKVGIYKYTDIVADADACKEDLMEAESLSAEELEQVNGNGFVDVFTKLNPGTEYYLLVWASNGYESKIISANATTTGDPLPIYMDYSYASIQEDMLPSASEGYFGMYNFYAVDHFGSLGMREYMSKVTIADSELADEDYEDEGVAYHDEYVDVTGVFDYSTKYGVVDSLVFVYENGVLYYVQNTLNSTGYFGKTFMSSSTSYYNGGWALYGGFVADGYIAFVCPEAYASYGINGMNLVLYSDEELTDALGVSEWYEDMLLVDPAKDDNGVAPAGVQKRIVALHKEMSKPLSFFENPAARVRTAFEKVRHMPTNVANIAGIKGEREVNTVAVETVKIEKPVRVNRFSNIEKVDVKAII